MAYKRINDYGVIGDMHSAALVGKDGSIDWLCLPRFDSPSVFAAILDDRVGGRFRISPAGQYASHQRYLSETNVLRTTFEAPEGAAALTDFMTMGEDITRSPHEVVRLLTGERGQVEIEVEFAPRLDYARGETSLSLNGERLAVARKGEDRLCLLSPVPLRLEEGTVRARFLLREGDRAAFLLRWQDTDLPTDGQDLFARLGKTEAFWRAAGREWRYPRRWEQVARRSLLALQLLLYAPTGAVCAAVTTSLPERIGGKRNWDYRFSWLRDTAFVMDIFNRLGHRDRTWPFIRWLAEMVTSSHRRQWPVCTISCEDGFGLLREEVLEHLEGYKGSRPVRIGNAASEQFQLDVYGELVLAFDSYERAGGIIDERLWQLIKSLVEAAIEEWRRPDHSIWEVRTEPRHFVFSKLMAWVAIDRGLRMARALRRPVDFARWRRAREEVRRDILEHGWDPQRESFVQYYGGRSLDASLLYIPLVGFLPPDDPRVVATVRRIQEELMADGLVRRYLPEETDDGLNEDEGTFTMCTLWQCEVLASMGDISGALSLFERVLSYGNEVGLFSEMLDPASGEFLGNYPQAFTHIALIHAARRLDRVLGQVEPGKVVAV